MRASVPSLYNVYRRYDYQWYIPGSALGACSPCLLPTEEWLGRHGTYFHEHVSISPQVQFFSCCEHYGHGKITHEQC